MDKTIETIYDTTKEKCQEMIKGICSGCGGKLEPIETVTNSGKPTFWSACPRCEVFDWGCDPSVFEIAQDMVINQNYVHYGNNVCPRPSPGNDSEKEYWLRSQIRGTTGIVRQVLSTSNKLKTNDNKLG